MAKRVAREQVQVRRTVGLVRAGEDRPTARPVDREEKRPRELATVTVRDEGRAADLDGHNAVHRALLELDDAAAVCGAFCRRL